MFFIVLIEDLSVTATKDTFDYSTVELFGGGGGKGIVSVENMFVVYAVKEVKYS